MNQPAIPPEMSTMAVTKTYSLTMLHIAKVSDMAQQLGVSQGEIMRQAIDKLYADIFPASPVPHTTE